MKKVFFAASRDDDVHIGRNLLFFVKGGHIIYRWKALVTLIHNRIRTMVRKLIPVEIFRFQICYVTSRDKFEIEISPQGLISDHSSYVIMNQRHTGFSMIYDMTPFGKKKYFFLLWRHRPDFDDVTGKLTVQTFPIWFFSKEHH